MSVSPSFKAMMAALDEFCAKAKAGELRWVQLALPPGPEGEPVATYQSNDDPAGICTVFGVPGQFYEGVMVLNSKGWIIRMRPEQAQEVFEVAQRACVTMNN